MSVSGKHLGHITWADAKAAAERNVPVLVPVGTVEAQGLHAVMGHDYIVAERLADDVAKRVDCLVVPTVPFGYSHFSKAFPGTISLRAETVRAIFFDIAEALVLHGFSRLIFFNNHGLNEPILGHVADSIRERHGVNIVSIFPYQVAATLGRDLYEDPELAFAHGGEPTISLLMYLAPEGMRMEGAGRTSLAHSWRGLEVKGPSSVRVGDLTATVYMDFGELAPAGGSGDPTQATAKKGEIIFARVVDAVAEFVDTFAGLELAK